MKSNSKKSDFDHVCSKSQSNENMAEVSASAVGLDDLFQRASSIVENARSEAYHYINETLVRRNWMLGKLIDEEELLGEERAAYGLKVIKNLSHRLTSKYGKGFTRRDLYHYLTFFKTYSDLFLSSDSKVYSVSTQSPILLSWTHYTTLLQELNTACLL